MTPLSASTWAALAQGPHLQGATVAWQRPTCQWGHLWTPYEVTPHGRAHHMNICWCIYRQRQAGTVSPTHADPPLWGRFRLWAGAELGVVACRTMICRAVTAGVHHTSESFSFMAPLGQVKALDRRRFWGIYLQAVSHPSPFLQWPVLSSTKGLRISHAVCTLTCWFRLPGNFAPTFSRAPNRVTVAPK